MTASTVKEISIDLDMFNCQRLDAFADGIRKSRSEAAEALLADALAGAAGMKPTPSLVGDSPNDTLINLTLVTRLLQSLDHESLSSLRGATGGFCLVLGALEAALEYEAQEERAWLGTAKGAE